MAYLYPIKIGFKSKIKDDERYFIDLYRIKIELSRCGKASADQRQGDTRPRRLKCCRRGRVSGRVLARAGDQAL
jgi:hypothetical protein